MTGPTDADTGLQGSTAGDDRAQGTARPPMKFDTMLSGLEEAGGQARRLEELGVDGAFTFEGPHDVFTPLVLAAVATTSLELATNVAIAFPRNPVQLAHQAYDLQLLSQGRFTLGLGSQIRAQVEKRYGASFDRPIARMRELVAALRAIFATWETGDRLDFRGEFTSHTLMPPTFNPGPPPVRHAAHRHRRAGPPDGAPGRRGGRRPAGHAVQHRAATSTSAPSRPSSEGLVRGGPDAVGADRHRRGHRVLRPGRRRDGGGPRWAVAGCSPSTRRRRPTGRSSRSEGWEDLQPELNRLSKSGRWEEMPNMIDDTMLATLAAVGSPKEVGGQIADRFGGLVDRVGFYTPYPSPTRPWASWWTQLAGDRAAVRA